MVNGSKKGLINFGDVPNAGGTSVSLLFNPLFTVVIQKHSFQAVNELINGLNF